MTGGKLYRPELPDGPGAAPSDAEHASTSAQQRRRAAEAGLCVVANLHKGSGDEELIAWAKATGRYVRIDRKTEWGNPFEIGKHGTRDEVIASFAEQRLPDLLPRLPDWRGKVLGCHCHPQKCHGHLLAAAINGA